MTVVSTHKDLFENSLHRAAELTGDITAPALERFFARFPEARLAFEAHSRGNSAKLQAQMVETALFCLMDWLEQPYEVVSLLTSSVPHHQGTLQVPLPWYEGLIAAVLDTIVATIPPDAEPEQAVCAELRRQLLGAVCAAG